MAGAAANAVAAYAESSGKLHTACGTHFTAHPAGASGVTLMTPAPKTKLYGDTGSSSRNDQAIRDRASVSTFTGMPVATTRMSAGTSTRKLTVALSEGWSCTGSQRCARSGQLSAKKV